MSTNALEIALDALYKIANGSEHPVGCAITAIKKIENLVNLDNVVCIDKAVYNELQNRELKLIALDHCGVDNWEGFDFAMEYLDELKRSKDDGQSTSDAR